MKDYCLEQLEAFKGKPALSDPLSVLSLSRNLIRFQQLAPAASAVCGFDSRRGIRSFVGGGEIGDSAMSRAHVILVTLSVGRAFVVAEQSGVCL